jgi:hypothetical protein
MLLEAVRQLRDIIFELDQKHRSKLARDVRCDRRE